MTKLNMTLFHRAKINDLLFPQHISKKICSLVGDLFIQCLEISVICWGPNLAFTIEVEHQFLLPVQSHLIY